MPEGRVRLGAGLLAAAIVSGVVLCAGCGTRAMTLYEQVQRSKKYARTTEAFTRTREVHDGLDTRFILTSTWLSPEWIRAFSEEAHLLIEPSEVLATRKVAAGSVLIWEDGEARSMAAISGHTPNGARIGYVYTPPSWRGRPTAGSTSPPGARHRRRARPASRVCGRSPR